MTSCQKSQRSVAASKSAFSPLSFIRSLSTRSDQSDGIIQDPQVDSRGRSFKTTGKRASRPKVRTGCTSCKRRHVKCDERKPACSRCENLGFPCEGYVPSKSAKQISHADGLLLPKPRLAPLAPVDGAPLQQTSSRAPLLVSPRNGFDFGEDGNWYFSLYRSKVARDLSPCHGDNFWSRLPLRDSLTRKSIRYSILSIGAYARALMELSVERSSLHAANDPWWPISVSNKHREAALSYHARALRCLQQEIHEIGVENRGTMVATLLFIVLENMMGNYHSSRNLVRSGIRILNNMGRAQSRKFKWKTHCDSFGPPEEIDEMAHIFSRHSISSVLLPFPRGKPASHALFEDNYHNPASHTSDTIYVYFETQASIPRTLEHARVIWEIICTSIGKFYAKAIWRNLNPDYRYDDELLSEQTFLMARLHDFGFGLAMLMAAGTNASALRRLAFVDTYHLLAKVLVPCCLDRTEMSYDGYATQFKDILAKARNLMSRSPLPNGTSFTNEVGWLPLITFVALKCRIHAVRLGALELLRESRWREGPWDGMSLAHAVSNLIQLEGQHDWNDSPSDLLPSSGMRYVWTNMFWDFENRRMTMEYTKAWADEPGELEKVTRTVSG